MSDGGDDITRVCYRCNTSLANLEREIDPPTWNDVPALRASNERLREAVALLNTLVLEGGSHSEYSLQLVRDALAEPWG